MQSEDTDCLQIPSLPEQCLGRFDRIEEQLDHQNVLMTNHVTHAHSELTDNIINVYNKLDEVRSDIIDLPYGSNMSKRDMVKSTALITTGITVLTFIMGLI